MLLFSVRRRISNLFPQGDLLFCEKNSGPRSFKIPTILECIITWLFFTCHLFAYQFIHSSLIIYYHHL